MGGVPGEGTAQTIDRLYGEAMEARSAGDMATAISKLEAVVARVPDHVDALLVLGTLYGQQDRLDEAHATLSRALALAPDYVDLRLALARVSSWREDHVQAAAMVDEILATRPDHVDALILRARLAYYVQDHELSETHYRRVLEREPENVEALLGLGDVEAAREEFDAADALYRRAAAIDPGSPEARERLSRERPRIFPWRLDVSGSYSWFERQPRKRWRESFNRVGYRFSSKTSVHASAEISQRFGVVDTFLGAGIHHRPLDWLTGYIEGGGTPSADFRERLTFSGGGTARLWRGAEALAATLITLDAKWARYGGGEVVTVKPGLQQYFLAGRVWLSGQWINIVDETDTHLQGWFGRVDALVHDRVRLYGGAANAPETVRNMSVQTFSVFGGVVVELNERLGLHLDYARDDRENSFVRNTIVLGLTVRY